MYLVKCHLQGNSLGVVSSYRVPLNHVLASRMVILKYDESIRHVTFPKSTTQGKR